MRTSKSRKSSNSILLRASVVDLSLAAVKCQNRDTSAHFSKFMLHRGTHSHELRKVVGTSKHIDSSAAFLFEVPGSNSPLVAQELQIGGTRLKILRKGLKVRARLARESDIS